MQFFIMYTTKSYTYQVCPDPPQAAQTFCWYSRWSSHWSQSMVQQDRGYQGNIAHSHQADHTVCPMNIKHHKNNFYQLYRTARNTVIIYAELYKKSSPKGRNKVNPEIKLI